MLGIYKKIVNLRDGLPSQFKKYATMFGGFLMLLSLQSFYTFGNIMPYIISYLRAEDESNLRYSEGIWFEVTYSTMQGLAAISAGQLVTKFNWDTKMLMIIGCLINSGILLTYLSIKSSFMLTLLTYSVINGLGMGVIYLLPLEYAMNWFPESKGLANSIVLFGYGLSSMIFSQVQTRYINPDNYSPDLPYDQTHPKEKYFSKRYSDLLERVPSIFLILGFTCLSLQIIACLLIFQAPVNSQQIKSDFEAEDKKKKRESDENSRVISLKQNDLEIDSAFEPSMNSLGVEFGNPNAGLNLKQVIRQPAYWMLVCMFILSSIGPSLSISFYKVFGEEFIKNDTFFATVNSVSSIFNAGGRFFWGFLIDRQPYKVCYLIMCTIMIVFVSTIYLQQFIVNEIVYLIWICGIFFAQCGNYIITPTVITKMFGPRNFTIIYASVTLLLLPSSFIKAGVSELQPVFGWFGIFMTGCTFMILGCLLAVFFNVKNHKHEDI